MFYAISLLHMNAAMSSYKVYYERSKQKRTIMIYLHDVFPRPPLLTFTRV